MDIMVAARSCSQREMLYLLVGASRCDIRASADACPTFLDYLCQAGVRLELAGETCRNKPKHTNVNANKTEIELESAVWLTCSRRIPTDSSAAKSASDAYQVAPETWPEPSCVVDQSIYSKPYNQIMVYGENGYHTSPKKTVLPDRRST